MVIDTSKLLTVSNYAKHRGVTRGRAYQWITEGKVKPVVIDGVPFIEKQ
jgi:predicted site-specific integrase-resolvase